VAVACPVVGIYPERGQAVIYGGAVHLGKDFIRDATGKRFYGYAAAWEGESWGGPEPRAPLVSLSQEHGIMAVADSLVPELEVGRLVVILPAHSCLTADLYREYRTLGNDTLNRLQSNADPDREV
jgi:D-serine deaminase-like pyridoxal phosphate-dependent protein